MKMCLCSTFKTDKIFKESDWLLEPKYDGMRCLAIKVNGEVSFKSRNGKEVYNTELIKKELEQADIDNVVLDGEVLSSNWNDTISIVHTQTEHPNKASLKFYVFDILSIDEWDNKRCTDTIINRKSKLNSIINEHIYEVPFTIVTSFSQTNKLYNTYLEQGFEGVVLKAVKSRYEWGRSKGWLKLKSVRTYDLKVIGTIEGLGRHVERLGALVCDHNGLEIKVGSGFTDAERDKFWNMKIVDRVIEVKCQEETKNGYLRFPVFVRLRQDK